METLGLPLQTQWCGTGDGSQPRAVVTLTRQLVRRLVDRHRPASRGCNTVHHHRHRHMISGRPPRRRYAAAAAVAAGTRTTALSPPVNPPSAISAAHIKGAQST